MFWTVLFRVGLLISTVLGGKQLYDYLARVEINPRHFYTFDQVADILGVEVGVVLKMVEKNQITTRTIGDEQRISGRTLLDFMKNEI